MKLCTLRLRTNRISIRMALFPSQESRTFMLSASHLKSKNCDNQHHKVLRLPLEAKGEVYQMSHEPLKVEGIVTVVINTIPKMDL